MYARVKVKKLHPDAIVPKYQTDGSACFDLHAVFHDPQYADSAPEGWTYVVSPGTPSIIKTGLAFEIPPNHVMLVFSRSGHGFRNDVRLANCVGVIDSDYRGELCVKLTNDNSDGNTFVVRAGDRIAQALILPLPMVRFEEVEELSETARGAGGLGSTGA